jgi:hypothetical protein
MIYRFTFFLVFVLNSWVGLAQPGNLVENPSFEFRPECDDNNGPLEEAPPWFNPTDATPDVFHECAIQVEDPCPYPEMTNTNAWLFGVPTNAIGCQEPHTGSGYAGATFYHPGISPDFIFREYLAAPLLEPLVQGENYYVRLYVSLAERSEWAVHAIQLALSADSITGTGFLTLPISPQLTNAVGDFITDKNGWTELSWEYTATGGERFIYIGNFQSNDDIEIQYALPDSIDPLWHNNSYYYIDDIYVGTDLLSTDVEIEASELHIWPNPVDDILRISLNNQTARRLFLFSVDGKLLLEKYYPDHPFDIYLNIGSLSSGVYIISIQTVEKDFIQKKFVKR